jgi:hypothetical protein
MRQKYIVIPEIIAFIVPAKALIIAASPFPPSRSQPAFAIET